MVDITFLRVTNVVEIFQRKEEVDGVRMKAPLRSVRGGATLEQYSVRLELLVKILW